MDNYNVVIMNVLINISSAMGNLIAGTAQMRQPALLMKTLTPLQNVIPPNVSCQTVFVHPMAQRYQEI